MPAGQLTSVIRQIRRLLGAPTGADLNDRQLLELFAESGDQNAFTALVERHGPLVWGVCRRVLDNDADAEDAFQATFWVLARKAGSIRWHESVANWLYGVAFRTARRARTKAGLRRHHEQQAAAMIASSGEPPIDWQELRSVLDEELMHVPARYRMPLLLCYLHGKTRDEAAEELGWTVGAVKGCLERGRELLRDRLARRGLNLSAVLLPTLLAEGALTAAPTALLNRTVTVVAAGTMSAPVAALVKGVMTNMFWKTATMWTAVLLAVGLIGSGGGMLYHHATAGGLAPLPEEGKKAPPAVKLSELVVKDGLSATVKPAKAEFEIAADKPAAGEVARKDRVFWKLLTGGDKASENRKAAEAWIIAETAKQGSPWASAATDWSVLPEQKAEIYASMLGGRIIYGEVARRDANGQVTIVISGLKLAFPSRRYTLERHQAQVVKITDYPGAGNHFLALWLGPEPPKDEPLPPPVKDAATGITVTVTDEGRSLTAADRQGKTLWKCDLIAAAGHFLGKPVIGAVSINALGKVEARFGKSNLALLDLQTGKILEILAR
jgi:RNA polymerase sigma factor (sigma-70 family)